MWCSMCEDLSVDIATPHGLLHAVRNLSFQVRRGETLCIVGESGCGKSMTSLAIMGLLPSRGEAPCQSLTLRSARICCARRASASTHCAATGWR